MKTTMFLSLAMSAGLALAADPLVSNVSASQGAGTRKVTVSYALANEPAVITIDVQTNRGDNVWVSIGADKQASITGDLNKLVQPGNHAVVWDARQDWPDQLITGGNIRFAVSAWTTPTPPLRGATPTRSTGRRSRNCVAKRRGLGEHRA